MLCRAIPARVAPSLALIWKCAIKPLTNPNEISNT
jgi:hypothetical protein